MKHDKLNKLNNINNKNEVFFKNLASLYTEKSGNELKKEFAGLNNSCTSADVLSLDKRVKRGIRADKVKKWTSRLLPLTACFIIFIAYIVIINPRTFNFAGNSDNIDNINNINYADSADNAGMAMEPAETQSEILTFEFISDKLPSGYILQKVDYDNQKAIYYIISDGNNEIILTVEEFTGNINTDGLEKISINNIDAYGISKKDFSFIQYKKDNFLYMLTSPYDYGELIRLSENLI